MKITSRVNYVGGGVVNTTIVVKDVGSIATYGELDVDWLESNITKIIEGICKGTSRFVAKSPNGEVSKIDPIIVIQSNKVMVSQKYTFNDPRGVKEECDIKEECQQIINADVDAVVDHLEHVFGSQVENG